ncbi:hypothetical protein [Fusobacterium sp. MFO224]|uniref:hypothetical protein n=1 Tax=Fusobacterium sp. MFO224 TaxID=3378070 RepID=UPI003855092C
MFSLGDYFTKEISGNEYDFEIIDNVTYESEDYLLADNEEGDTFVFIDNDGDEPEYLEELDLADEILDFWRYSQDNNNIGDWEEDEYYDREDRVNTSQDFDNENYDEDSDY